MVSRTHWQKLSLFLILTYFHYIHMSLKKSYKSVWINQAVDVKLIGVRMTIMSMPDKIIVVCTGDLIKNSAHAHKFLFYFAGSACRVLRSVFVRHAPKLHRVSFIQCKKLRNMHLINEVCSQPAEKSKFIFLRPMTNVSRTLPFIRLSFIKCSSHTYETCNWFWELNLSKFFSD